VLLVVNTCVVEARLGEAVRRKVLGVVYKRPRQRNRFLKQLIGLGGTPPARSFPLQECEGDCDTDDDVSLCSVPQSVKKQLSLVPST
jgi:hypothetical protein